MNIWFVVYGVPIPKGSKSIVTRGGKSVLIDGTMSKCKDKDERARRNKARSDWPRLVEEAASSRGLSLRFDGPVNVCAVFFFPRPKSETKAQRLRIFHTTMPDLDKLLRGVLDPMKKAGVFVDDARVVSFNGSAKRYVEFQDSPRVEINVTTLAETP